jgi:PST family polysaccharide transporter
MIKWLPNSIRSRIESSPDLQRILPNAGWLTAERILRLIVGLIMTTWLARYLGPNNFGALNLAIALVALWSTFGTLGLKSIVVRDLIRAPEAKNQLIGTTLILQLCGSVFVVVLATITSYILKSDERPLVYLVVIISSAALLRSTDAFKYWFESQVRSKTVVLIESMAFTISSIIKLILIYSGAPLISFAYVILIESIITACGITALYHHTRTSSGRLHSTIPRAVELEIDPCLSSP